ncbi:phage tail protein [Mesorhizobium japonicum]|uniref:Mlr6554 protein n=1 Tax=Mesorhizobium japonicum (strain LMG 29417 / CECT 9101 / MAFF 303099) TaxID=266835 RepID=Q988X4_RHILO|nr:phage tail protein [Mesorhizobium japonicum]BAB52823.1 mlr6554 [Mesorhizobium japonicum MAFF 303099]
MKRQDPLRGFRFLVEIEGLTSAGFLRIKGLQREIKHESYREGGVNEYEHKLFSQVSYPSVVLERGLAHEDLWRWALAASEGNIQRKTVRIRLQSEAGEPSWAWQLDWAIPVKWAASDLDANSSQIVVESLELAHHGLRRAA